MSLTQRSPYRSRQLGLFVEVTDCSISTEEVSEGGTVAFKANVENIADRALRVPLNWKVGGNLFAFKAAVVQPQATTTVTTARVPWGDFNTLLGPGDFPVTLEVGDVTLAE